jgi:hypothetical protein
MFDDNEDEVSEYHVTCEICGATMGIAYHGACGACTNTAVIKRRGHYICGPYCLSTWTRLEAAERYGALVNARTRAQALGAGGRVAALAAPAARAWKLAAREIK